jgi:hypothetical protein
MDRFLHTRSSKIICNMTINDNRQFLKVTNIQIAPYVNYISSGQSRRFLDDYLDDYLAIFELG